MHNDLTKLKELAERATPGPWTTDAAQSVIAESDQLNSGWVICECFGSDEKANREFIKNANPQAILGLIAEVERLRGQVDHLINQHMPREPIPDMPGYSRVVDAERLVAENEVLRSALQAVQGEVDGNIRPLTRDLVNMVSGVKNGSHPNDIYDH